MKETDKEKDITGPYFNWDKVIAEDFDPLWKEAFEKMILKLFPDMSKHESIKRSLWVSFRSGGINGLVTMQKYLRERFDFVEKKKNEPAPPGKSVN